MFRTTALAGLLITATACISVPGSRVRLAEPAERLRLIAVAPVQIRYDDKTFEAQRRTEDILATLWTDSLWPILGPTAFSVLDVRDRDPLRGTDVLVRIRPMNVLPEQVAVLQTVLSVREASGRAVMSGDRSGKSADYAVDGVVSMTLTGAGGRLIAEIEVVRGLDPFAERPEYDPRPNLRVAIIDATRLLINRLDSSVEPGPALDLSTFPSSSTILRGYRQRVGGVPQAPGADDGGDDTDDATHQLQVWRAAQYFSPDITLESALAQDLNPPGFCLRAAAPPFFDGDCVLALNGASITSPHALRAAQALSVAGEMVLTVVGSDGIARRVSFP